MKTCLRCSELKAQDLFSVDKGRKDGLSAYCKPCRCEIGRESYRRSDKSKHLENTAKWRKANPERVKHLSQAAHQKHKEKRNAASVKYRAENSEKTRALCRQWAKDNAEKMRITNADRRAKKKNAIPLWADDEFDRLVVVESYSLAKLRTAITGVPWHVDHVVPLRNKRVCGLHCAANLQVITAVANHVKGNRVWPDMWKC